MGWRGRRRKHLLGCWRRVFFLSSFLFFSSLLLVDIDYEREWLRVRARGVLGRYESEAL